MLLLLLAAQPPAALALALRGAPPLRSTSFAPRSHPTACAAETTSSLPLFDPAGDTLPFPFPVPTPSNALVGDDEWPAPSAYRYAFDRPLYLRMLRDLPDAGGDEPRCFGHCVVPGEGELTSSLALGPSSTVRAGTVGVRLRVDDVVFSSRDPSPMAQATASDQLGSEVKPPPDCTPGLLPRTLHPSPL